MSQAAARKARKQSGPRQRFTWIVTLQGMDGVEEVEYAAYWSPEKTEAIEVAEACAVEKTYFGPKDGDGNPTRPYGAIAARLAA